MKTFIALLLLAWLSGAAQAESTDPVGEAGLEIAKSYERMAAQTEDQFIRTA
jgi:hypothetical protein